MCTSNGPCMFHRNTQPIVTRKLTLADLITIRRKVDKATKRADEVIAQTEALSIREWQHKTLGYVDIPASALAKTLDPNMGCDLRMTIYRGDYSPCYPASIGPSVAYLDLPKAVAVNAWDARNVARDRFPRHFENPLAAMADVDD